MRSPAASIWWRLCRWSPAVAGRRCPAVLDPRAWFWFLAQDLGVRPPSSGGGWARFRRRLALICAGDVRRLRRLARDFYGETARFDRSAAQKNTEEHRTGKLL